MTLTRPREHRILCLQLHPGFCPCLASINVNINVNIIVACRPVPSSMQKEGSVMYQASHDVQPNGSEDLKTSQERKSFS